MDIIIGTSNKGKIREIAAILAPLGYTLIPKSADIAETGETVEKNAIIKALAYSKINKGKYVIAEDSGLIVPNLGGLPGTYSSRFHTITFDKETLKVIDVPEEKYTTDKTELDKLNNALLLKLANERLKDDERGAYLEVCFVVAKDGEILFSTEEKSYGYISKELKGENGFGYDPLFIGVDTFDKTYAELDNARKNLRSHRKKALQKLGLWMAQNIENN